MKPKRVVKGNRSAMRSEQALAVVKALGPLPNPTLKKEDEPLPLADFVQLTAKQAYFLSKFPGNAFVITRTCRKVGMHKDTFFDWCSRDENFRRCLDEIFARNIGAVEAAQYAFGMDKRGTLERIHVLKNRHPAYREKLEITSKHEGPAAVEMMRLNAVATVELLQAAVETMARLMPPRDAVAVAKPILDAVETPLPAVEEEPLLPHAPTAA